MGLRILSEAANTLYKLYSSIVIKRVRGTYRLSAPVDHVGHSADQLSKSVAESVVRLIT